MDCEQPTSTRSPSCDDEKITMANNVSDNVMSMDDYMSTLPLTSADSKTSVPLPRAVGSRTSKHTIALNEKYQSLAIPKPDFRLRGSTTEGWSGTVVFVALLGTDKDVEVEEKGPFGSKQETKERLSLRALEVLDNLEQAGELGKRVLQKKGKQGNSTEAQGPGMEEKAPSINYVGQLLEFQRSSASPQPTYTDYQLGNAFTCLATIDGHPCSFGSTDNLFTSKKAARQDAARHAVQHFKTIGSWPDTFTKAGGIRKNKAAQSPPSPTIRSPINAEDGGVDSGGQCSYAQQVAQLAAQLALPTPLWSYSTVPAPASGFHTVSCSFKDSAGHDGPIGEVRHIFGKKKAKEECARLTLRYLLRLKEERLHHGRQTMESGFENERLLNSTAGQSMDGEKDRDKAESLS